MQALARQGMKVDTAVTTIKEAEQEILRALSH